MRRRKIADDLSCSWRRWGLEWRQRREKQMRGAAFKYITKYRKLACKKEKMKNL